MTAQLHKLACMLFLAIVPVNVSADAVSPHSKQAYLNGNSQELIQHYESEIKSGRAHPLLILADIEHIRQIAGLKKTLQLLEGLLAQELSPEQYLYVKDMVALYAERYARHDSKGGQRWNMYDNSKSPMPRNIASVLLKDTPLILPDKNNITIAQTNEGYVPLKQYTQNHHSMGLISSSFTADKPVTIYIYSNTEYVLFINGMNVCVNAATHRKRTVRMIHIKPQAGFAISVYYKPKHDMFMKVLFRGTDDAPITLPAVDKDYFHPVDWHEVLYSYHYQLIADYLQHRTFDAALQLALFHESLQCIEALKYYREIMPSNDEYAVYRFCSLLLEQSDGIPGAEFIVKEIMHNNNALPSPLGSYLTDVLFNGNTHDMSAVTWLPVVIEKLKKNREEIIRSKKNVDYLLERFPNSNELRFAAAEITSQFDIKKAVSQLGGDDALTDKELELLLECLQYTKQYERIADVLEENSNMKFFYCYIDALIKMKQYNHAKRLLFRTIAQGFDSYAYDLLEQIAGLEGYDGSMYKEKHAVIVSKIPSHRDYLKNEIEHYAKKSFFSRFAYEALHRKNQGLFHSQYAVRMVDDAIYCSIFDAYYLDDIGQINTYQFGKDIELIQCTVYSIDENGVMTIQHMEEKALPLNEQIRNYLHGRTNRYAAVEISFKMRKKIPVFHIQQNYTKSKFDVDIITISPHSNAVVAGTMPGNAAYTEGNVRHFIWDSSTLSASKKREFVVMDIQPEPLIAWITEQSLLFRRGDFLSGEKKLEFASIEDAAHQVVKELQGFEHRPDVFSSTSLLHYVYAKTGTQLDAMFYARRLLAKNGIIAYIGLSVSQQPLHREAGSIFFDGVFLFIPVSAGKGIWLTGDGMFHSLSEMNADEALILVGEEIIRQSREY